MGFGGRRHTSEESHLSCKDSEGGLVPPKTALEILEGRNGSEVWRQRWREASEAAKTLVKRINRRKN